MPIMEINGQRVEFDKEPTPEDIDYAASNLGISNQGFQQEPGGFTQADLSQFGGGEEPKDIGFTRNLAMGFAPNDRAKQAYLQEEFSGSNITQDDTGNILVDGRRINPAGFDFGDVLRNLGYALPIAGQIGGGIAGATSGSIVPGAGTTAGAIGGGVAGGVTGEAARLGVGKLFGIDPTLAEASGALAKEGILSAGGEIVGRGLGVGARALGRTGFGQALGSFWNNTVNKLGKGLTGKIAKFVGGIDENAIKVSEKFNYSNLNNEYFREDKTLEIAKNVILGNKKFPTQNVSSITKNGIQEGTELIAKSIKDTDDLMYDNLIRNYSGISDDTINTIKATDIKNIISPDNMSKEKPVRLAQSIINQTQSHLDTIGSELGRAEAAAIKAGKGVPFQTIDIVNSLDRVIKESGLLGSKRLAQGFKASPPIDVKGRSDLLQLRSLFGQKLTKAEITKRFGKEAVEKFEEKFFFFGQKVGDQTLKGIDTRSASAIRKRMNILADNIFQNKNVPSEVKRIVFDTTKEFRQRYHSQLGIEDVSARYGNFKSLMSEARIDRDNVVNELINKVNKFQSNNQLVQENIEGVLRELPGGKSLSKEIKFLEAGNELKRVDSFKTLSKFEADLNNNNVLDLAKTNTKEDFVKQIDSLFESSKNPKVKSKVFFKEAQKALAAKKFIEGSPNLLRVGAVRSLIGAGALGGVVGGPVGAAAGGILSLSISNPKNIAKMLVKLANRKGKSIPGQQLLRRASGVSQKVTPASITQVLAQLAGSQ